MHKLLRYSYPVLIPLIAGLSIYLLLRHDTLFIGALIGLEDGLLCDYVSDTPFMNFVIYCVPDGLWYLSLLHVNELIHKQCLDNRKTILDWVVLTIPYSFEIAQLTEWIPGTFDLMDILTYVVITTIYLIWKRKNLQEYCS